MQAVVRLKYFLEKYGFHVSSRLADKLGMRVTNVRLFFIYISFVTVGLGFGVYLTLAFWIRLKDLIRAKRTSVFVKLFEIYSALLSFDLFLLYPK